MNRWLTFCRSFVTFAVLVVVSGCELVSNDKDDDPASFADFGDPYTLIERTLFGTGDLMPNLSDEGVVNVRVQYSGGCEEHDFDLNYRLTEEDTTAEIWVQHDAKGDMCEALVTREYSYTLPQEVSSATTILFIGPDAFRDVLRVPGNSEEG